MNSRILKLTMAAAVAWPAVSAVMPAPVVLAEETAEDAEFELIETETPVEEETVTEAEAPVEEMTAEEEIPAVEEIETYRDGTDVGCNLNLDVKVDGSSMSSLNYLPGTESHDVQVGGNLVMTNVWNSYKTSRLAYITSQTLKGMSREEAIAKFHTKALKGSWTYHFQINPEVVTVNEDILTSTEAWQNAFETGSGAEAAGFFSFMRCSNVAYDAATGKVSVTFVINHNGGSVSTAVIDGDASCKPANIHAYSPEGAFTIKAEDFKKGAAAVYGNADFAGEIDMDPWMAIGFPIRFKAAVEQPHLTLDVANANVTFDVENGTWADGTTDTRTETVPVDVFKLEQGGHVVAGTLTEEMIPSGMLAAEGFMQENGAWDVEPTTEENHTVFYDAKARSNELTIGYTYSFPAKEAEKPEEPTTPEKPDNKEEDKDKEENKDKDTSSQVPTAVTTGFGALLGLQAASLAGLTAIIRRRRK